MGIDVNCTVMFPTDKHAEDSKELL